MVEAPAGQSVDVLRKQLGAAAAHYLARTVRPGENIGMAWGGDVERHGGSHGARVRTGVRALSRSSVALEPRMRQSTRRVLVRRLARLLDAQAILLPAPGVVANPAVRDALRKDPHVRAALEELGSLDTVFIGLGSLASNPVLNDGHTLSKLAIKDLRTKNAVGDIALRFFDAHGRPVDTALDNRILGITTDQLREVDRVVAVAGGKDKVSAIAAALEAEIVDVLITDRATAEALVALAG